MDVDKISKLLDVVDGTRGHPKLKAIHDKAMKELEELSAKEEKPEEPVRRPVLAGASNG